LEREAVDLVSVSCFLAIGGNSLSSNAYEMSLTGR